MSGVLSALGNRWLVPLCLLVGGLMWLALQRSPAPTFNYHGPNSFWGPVLLRLLLGGGVLCLLGAVGPLSALRFIADRQAGTLGVESVVVTAAGLFACGLLLSQPLCERLLPGESVPKHVTVAIVLTALAFLVIAPGLVARVASAGVAVAAAGFFFFSFVSSTSTSSTSEHDPRALQRAVIAGALTGVQLLLRAGHDPNNPVPVLLDARGAEMVTLLLAHGADPNSRVSPSMGGAQTALAKACRQPDVAAVVALLDAGARVDDANALRDAADWLQGDHVRVLLARGADASAPKLLEALVGSTPHDEELLKLERAVLAHGLVPERDEERRRALGVGILKNNRDAVSLLLPTVADRCSGKGGSALDVARRIRPELVPLVLSSCEGPQ
ncbi:MAG: ankyrin repeat domain-containing protein [Deltaproteobacteria bacterium]|nr:ankyrin repeat domain-containing protein [Deltaproteobacteria bacterium]